MPYSDSSIDHTALSCLSVYKTSGLSDTISGLLVYLQDMMPVTRLNCAFVLKDGPLFTQLADTSRARAPGEFRPFIMPDRMDEVVVLGDIPAMRRERGIAEDDPRIAGRSFQLHNSLLRFPLFSTLEHIFVVHLWSHEFNAFSMRDYALVYRLMAPLVDDLALALSTLESSRPTQSLERISHYQQLRQCPGLKKALGLAQKAASTNAPVLILGETGAGKGVTAASIHELSPRKDRPFIHINCGAIPESLLESELFGHERGSFTGAHALRAGYFEQADGGTIFLDEIGEMSPSAQIRLLRIFDTGSINRVGGGRPVPLNVRVIAATNSDLRRKVRKGAFRRDLWYRLSVFPLEIPPLRSRKEDIPFLITYFLQTKALSLGLGTPPPVPGREMARLRAHDWPGNVRELEHVVERSLIMHSGGGPLNFHLDALEDAVSSDPGPSGLETLAEGWPSLAQLEQRYIRAVIKETGGKLTGAGSATEILRVHYSTLRSHLQQMGLWREKSKREEKG